MNDDDDDDDQDLWQENWNARTAAIESVLGPMEENVGHSVLPFDLGGNADIIYFRKHIPGCVAVTCDLLGEETQQPNELGNFELMIAQRDNERWGAGIICRLARYTCETTLEPGHTMDIAPATPKGSTLAAFLFCEYARFKFLGSPAGLLLCFGITASELNRCREVGVPDVLQALKKAKVYPYTDLYRKSVL